MRLLSYVHMFFVYVFLVFLVVLHVVSSLLSSLMRVVSIATYNCCWTSNVPKRIVISTLGCRAFQFKDASGKVSK